MSKLVVTEKSTQVTLYSGPDDPDLPDHVKTLPAMVKSRWVNNYNYCVMDCQDSENAQEMADEQTMVSVDDMMDMPMASKEAPFDAELTEGEKAVLTAKKRDGLSKGQFAYVDENGTGHLPIHDAAHVRNAMARFNQTDMPSAAKMAARHKIMAAAKRMGVKADNFKEANSEGSPPGIAPVLPANTMSLIDRFKAWLSAEDKAQAGTESKGKGNLETFALKEGPDGRMHAVLVFSNIFKDRHGQMFSEAAHKEYEEALDSGQAPYPEFHIWHGGPQSRWGVAENIAFVNGFMVAGGVVDPGKENVALKLKELADGEGLTASHGFLGWLGKDDVYHMYRSFEISALPPDAESNPWTAADFSLATKENDMAWTTAKKQYFAKHFGWDDTKLTEAENKFDAMTTALKSAGVEWKEAGEEPAAPPPPPVLVAPPAPVQADPSPMLDLVLAVKELAGALTTMKADIDALKTQGAKSVEEQAQNSILAQIAQTPNAGFSPANSPTTLAPGMKQAPETDWLTDVLSPVFNMAPQGEVK